MNDDIQSVGFEEVQPLVQNDTSPHTTAEVRILLNKAPSLILKAEKVVAECRDNVRKKELAYDLAYAVALNAAEGTVQAKQAAATTACQKEEGEKSEAKKELDFAIAAMNYANNAFVAIRKEASLIEGEMKSIGYED